jgi:hypothetical protein
MNYTKDNPKLVKNSFRFKGVKTFTGVVKDKDNTIAYYLNGNIHRTDGPACEYANGNKEWFLNGEYHREDGPAVEYANDRKEWYLNGKCYGSDNDYTNESWIRLVKLELFK